MSVSIRRSVTAAIALPLIVGILLIAVVSTQRAAADRLADMDDDLAGRASALASYAAFHDGVFTVDFEGGPGPAPDVTASLIAWRVASEPSGDVVFEGKGPRVTAPPLPPIVQADVATADWPRPWRLGAPSLSTLEGEGGPARVWTGRFLVRVEQGDVEMVRGGDEAPTVVVTVAEDLAPMRADNVRHVQVVAAAGLLTSLLAAGLGALLSRRITGPLERLARDARAVQGPASEPPLTVQGGGREVEALAHSLNEAFVRVHDAYARQTRFAADASHELRTPLTMIRTEAEVTLRVEALSPPVRAALEGVLEGAVRMQDILDGLLLLARADAGVSGLREAVDLRALVDDEASSVRPRVVAVEGAAVMVDAVPSQLRFVVRNLLENAVRHTPEGGRVKVLIATTRGGVQMQVIDTGAGIPEAALPHVFERFYVADAARQRSQSGAGLGLAIVKAVTEAHGGSVQVRSVVGEGSTFTVTLPR